MTALPAPGQPIPLRSLTDLVLAEHAAVIKALGKRVVADVIEIGGRLNECKGICGHGRWLPWLEREFGWDERTARNFMSVHEMSLKSEIVSDLDLPMRSLYLLAAPSTPEVARDAVLELAANGKAITHEQVREMIEKARAQTNVERAKERAEADAAHASKLEQLLANNRIELAAREQAVRAEYESKMLIDGGDLAAQIEEAVGPLIKKIEAQQKKLDKLHEREKARKQRDGKPPLIDANTSLASTSVRLALGHLTASLHRIEPRQVIEIEQKAAGVTQETLRDRIGEAVLHAKSAHSWISEFIQLAEEATR